MRSRSGDIRRAPAAALAFAPVCLWVWAAAPCAAEQLQVGSAGGSGSLVEPIFSLESGPPVVIESGVPAVGETADPPEPAPPPDKRLNRHVTDQAGLILAVIESRLETEFQMRAKQEGVHLYFVTVDKPPVPAVEYAASLCEATLPARQPLTGGVLVLETSPSRITVALTAKARLLLSDEALAELIDKAVADQPEDVSPGALLAFTGRRLADRLRNLEAERSDSARVRNLILLSGGGIAAVVLLVVFVRGFIAMWISNLFDRRYTFPETSAAERFGALNGGGHGAVIEFSRKD